MVEPEKSAGLANISNETKFSVASYGVASSPRVTTVKRPRKGGGRYLVGKPYTIKGRKYHPKEDPDLKQTGMASWYGPNFHGRLTANGEIYDQYSLSAAHPTMPLPSYAHVTNLENGRSLTVRVNDRGPFAHNRVIDLSAKAAKLLGYDRQGMARVRVEYAGKAPLHGEDESFLLASFKGPGTPADIGQRGRAPSTMIALAETKAPERAQAAIAASIRNDQVALPGRIPVPVKRPALLPEVRR